MYEVDKGNDHALALPSRRIVLTTSSPDVEHIHEVFPRDVQTPCQRDSKLSSPEQVSEGAHQSIFRSGLTSAANKIELPPNPPNAVPRLIASLSRIKLERQMYVASPSQKRKKARTAIIRRWKSFDGPGEGICSICVQQSKQVAKIISKVLAGGRQMDTCVVYPITGDPVEAPQEIQHGKEGDEGWVEVIPECRIGQLEFKS